MLFSVTVGLVPKQLIRLAPKRNAKAIKCSCVNALEIATPKAIGHYSVNPSLPR